MPPYFLATSSQEGEPTEESPSPGPGKEYEIPKGMPMGEARGIAVKFAMKGMGKDKKPPFGKM